MALIKVGYTLAKRFQNENVRPMNIQDNCFGNLKILARSTIFGPLHNFSDKGLRETKCKLKRTLSQSYLDF